MAMFAAELETIQVLQQLDLQWLMQGLSFAGYGELYLAIFMYLYWCRSPATGLRLGLFLMLSSAVNQLLKLGLHAPRPYWLQADLLIGQGDPASGLPSGHAQSAVVFWFTLAAGLRRNWLWVAGLVLILGIGLSRVWLGVHFPHQVLAGWLVGLALFWLLHRAEAPLLRSLRADSPALQLLTCVLASIALVLLGLMLRGLFSGWEIPEQWMRNALRADINVPIDPLGLKGLVRDAGLLLGLSAGAVWLAVRDELQILSGRQVGVFLGGALGAGLIWYGGGWLRNVLTELPARLVAEYLRALLLGLWISAGWPVVWRRIAGGRRVVGAKHES